MAARTLVSSAGDLPSATSALTASTRVRGRSSPGLGVGLGVAAAAGDVLADIGQHRVAGQGPGQEDGLVAGEVGEQVVQPRGLAVRRLLRGGLAGRGHQLGGVLAVQIGDGLVQQVAEQVGVLSHVAAGGAITVAKRRAKGQRHARNSATAATPRRLIRKETYETPAGALQALPDAAAPLPRFAGREKAAGALVAVPNTLLRRF
jgi:hypothetical protein